MCNKTILIDLDGVLNRYNGKFDETKIPPIKSGAKTFLRKLSKDFDIKIFTTRNKMITLNWLIKNDIDKYVSGVTNIKTPAFLHIDDRGLCFKGDFQKCYNEIINFTPYWKT